MLIEVVPPQDKITMKIFKCKNDIKSSYVLKPLNAYQRNRRHNHLHMYLWQILPNCCILLEYNMFHSYRLRYLYMHHSRFEKQYGWPFLKDEYNYHTYRKFHNIEEWQFCEHFYILYTLISSIEICLLTLFHFLYCTTWKLQQDWYK